VGEFVVAGDRSRLIEVREVAVGAVADNAARMSDFAVQEVL
jgi:hypothetical protein